MVILSITSLQLTLAQFYTIHFKIITVMVIKKKKKSLHCYLLASLLRLIKASVLVRRDASFHFNGVSMVSQISFICFHSKCYYFDDFLPRTLESCFGFTAVSIHSVSSDLDIVTHSLYSSFFLTKLDYTSFSSGFTIIRTSLNQFIRQRRKTRPSENANRYSIHPITCPDSGLKVTSEARS